MARHLLSMGGFFHTVIFWCIFWKGRNICRLASTSEISCFSNGRWNIICSITSVRVCHIGFWAIARSPLQNLPIRLWFPATSRSSIFACEVTWCLKSYNKRFISSLITLKNPGVCTEYNTAYYTLHPICSETFLQHRQYMNLISFKIFLGKNVEGFVCTEKTVAYGCICCQHAQGNYFAVIFHIIISYISFCIIPQYLLFSFFFVF